MQLFRQLKIFNKEILSSYGLPLAVILFVHLYSGFSDAYSQQSTSNQSQFDVPQYRVDASWPGELPNNWILGQVAGIAVDRRDHIWIIHRPRTITAHEAGAVQNPPTAICCVHAPSVIEFDAEGDVVQAWGGPVWDQASTSWIEPDHDWPENEHGIYIDGENNVWLAGNGANDHIVVKMTMDGKYLMTIGIKNETGGSNDPRRLGQPADIFVDNNTREVYVADGYKNRRVIVFDMDTGEYKRHWGAYGNKPGDGELPAYQPGMKPFDDFSGPVHALEITDDGLLYVADRSSNRIQVFRPDGTYLKEKVIGEWTTSQGAIWDIESARFANERWLFVADGHNKQIWILERDSLDVVATFGRGGRQVGQFEWVHNITADSKGNLYTTEVNTGKRIQKFRLIND